MDNYQDEDDNEFVPRPYEQGIWEWSNDTNQLIFIKKIDYNYQNFALYIFLSGRTLAQSDWGCTTALPDILPPSSNVDKSRSEIDIKPYRIRKMEFKAEIDLMEEQWFKKHYQRQISEDDVIKLQDVKDVAFFTAPKKILTRVLIKVLHLPAMDRFLRALIFYCQYYLQIGSEMAERCLQLQYKIKTGRSQQIENTYQDNLQDLRLLLAKEYCGLILGTGEYFKYHHMGVDRTRSFTKQDSILFETILLISIHIVWIALGRKSFEQLELEIQRVFKSNTFNATKRKLESNFDKKLSSAEYVVLFGGCDRGDRKMALRSPLTNEMICKKNNTDYRLLGIGSVEYPTQNARLLYFKNILSSPEVALKDIGLSLGIIGLPHERFDTMLREIKKPSTSSTSIRKLSLRRSSSARSSVLKSDKFAFENSKLYQDITLPEKRGYSSADLPEDFAGKVLPRRVDKNEQRQKWLRLAAATKRKEIMKRNARKKIHFKQTSC